MDAEAFQGFTVTIYYIIFSQRLSWQHTNNKNKCARKQKFRRESPSSYFGSEKTLPSVEHVKELQPSTGRGGDKTVVTVDFKWAGKANSYIYMINTSSWFKQCL